MALDDQEQTVRSVMAKLETGLIERMVRPSHECQPAARGGAEPRRTHRRERVLATRPVMRTADSTTAESASYYSRSCAPRRAPCDEGRAASDERRNRKVARGARVRRSSEA